MSDASSVAWDFGDGNTATEAVDVPVTHTYASPGERTVSAEINGDQVTTTVQATARYRNLLPSDNAASAEDGTTAGWYRNSTSLVWESSAEQALHGERSLKFNTGSGGTRWLASGTAPLIDAPGKRYTAMFGIWAITAMPRFYYALRFQNDMGNNIDSDTIALPLVAGDWTLVRVEKDAPVDADRCRVNFNPDSWDMAGYIDRVGIFEGSVAWEDWSLPSEFVP